MTNLSRFLGIIYLLSSSFVGAQSTAEWKHDKPDYDPTQTVTVKTADGGSLDLTSAQSILSSSSAPNMLVMEQGSSGGYNYDFDFAIRVGTSKYYVRDKNLRQWFFFTASEFNNKFTVTASENIELLTRTYKKAISNAYSVSGSGSSSFTASGNTFMGGSYECSICSNVTSCGGGSTSTSAMVYYGFVGINAPIGADYINLSCNAGVNNGTSWRPFTRGFANVTASYNDGFVIVQGDCGSYIWNSEINVPKTVTSGGVSDSGSKGSISCSTGTWFHYKTIGGQAYGVHAHGNVSGVRFYIDGNVSSLNDTAHRNAIANATRVYVIPSISTYLSMTGTSVLTLAFHGQFEQPAEVVQLFPSTEAPTLAITGLSLK